MNDFTVEVVQVGDDFKLKVINTGGFDAAKHLAAEEFLKELQSAMGGDTTVRKIPGALNPQQHAHGHQHHKH